MKTTTKILESEILVMAVRLVVFIALPVVLVLSIPLLLYRQLIVLIAKLYQPDLTKIVPASQVLMTHDNLHDEDLVGLNICTWHIYDGPLSINSVRNIVEQNFVLSHGADGQLEFPEAQQYFVKFGGYLFWKWDRNFDISHHVRSMEQSKTPTTEEDLQRIISHLTSAKWPRNRSMWEMLILNNYKSHTGDVGEKSVMIFRFHHSLADGYSYLNFMVRRICAGSNKIVAAPTNPKITWYQQILFYLTAPYSFVRVFICRRRDVSPWSLPVSKLQKRFSTVWSDPVSIDSIKRIKSAHGVSFQAVLNALIAGTVQRLMSGKGQRVPDTLTFFMPLPLRNHPGGLSLHTAASLFRVPVGAKSPSSRLRLAHSVLKDGKHPGAAWLGLQLYKFLGLLPWVVGEYFPPDFATIGGSCFPGVSGDVWLDGRKALEVNFSLGTEKGPTVASFTTLSCFGSLRLVMSIDKALYATKDIAQDFNAAVREEINELINSC